MISIPLSEPASMQIVALKPLESYPKFSLLRSHCSWEIMVQSPCGPIQPPVTVSLAQI